MKILMTTDTLGGVWTFSMTLVRELIERGHEVLLVSSGRLLSPGQRREAEAVHGLRLVETGYRLEWMPDPWDDVDAMGRLLLEVATDFRPDVVHLNEYAHASLEWTSPVLVVGHSCVLSWMKAVRGTEAGGEWHAYRKRVAAGLAAADLVVAPTRWMLGQLEHEHGTMAARLVIPNACSDVDRPRATPKGDWIFSAGRLWDEAKNVTLLAAVAPSLAWPVVVAGERSLPYERNAQELRTASLRLLGELSRERMRGCYAGASIYALPARYEPFGLTALEAAAAGCALVLADLPSLRETWKTAAEYAPPDDPHAWTCALGDLIADGDRRRRLASAAVVRSREFTAERLATRYLAAYESLVERCGERRGGAIPDQRRVPCAS